MECFAPKEYILITKNISHCTEKIVFLHRLRNIDDYEGKD